MSGVAGSVPWQHQVTPFICCHILLLRSRAAGNLGALMEMLSSVLVLQG